MNILPFILVSLIGDRIFLASTAAPMVSAIKHANLSIGLMWE